MQDEPARLVDNRQVRADVFNPSAMSPTNLTNERSAAVSAALRNFFARFGARVTEARLARKWTAQRLAKEAGISRGLVYLAARGEPVSLEAVLRMATALDLKLDWELVDPRRRADRPTRWQDPVHSLMGEYEAAHLRPLKYSLSIDEPYQHYHFAGRADVVAWHVEEMVLLHIENRTRFLDIQEAAGAYNAKRAYLGAALAQRLGIRGWRSQTHVMAALWSAEISHTLRLRPGNLSRSLP